MDRREAERLLDENGQVYRAGIITGICIGAGAMLFGIFMKMTVEEIRKEVWSHMN